jgi:hypothetical protein
MGCKTFLMRQHFIRSFATRLQERAAGVDDWPPSTLTRRANKQLQPAPGECLKFKTRRAARTMIKSNQVGPEMERGRRWRVGADAARNGTPPIRLIAQDAIEPANSNRGPTGRVRPGPLCLPNGLASHD